MAVNAAAASSRTTVTLIVLGFVAGAIGVLVFQQAAVGVLHSFGLTPGTPFNMRPAIVTGVPQFLSSAFWGGLWGIAFALVAARLPARRYWSAALLFGAVLLPLVGWFIVAPLRGAPLGFGWQPSRVALSVVVNGIWGLGAAATLLWLQRIAAKAIR